ncbi:1-acyl-sn-glycerol-3-phosphate acyltransferase [Paroceanicella profunda]|uniref:1-acyl-sn-glycerol-3-phosphate acyltransferase n=1 Tax=Paroceanicella profunda TaxID=2579971 RepID=A0A5B8G1C7_9RHOB|nr:lysophospholipid acyltransferase family protein [Paroceanicella profunda]QDL92273.1 1-acyl-sn-glycerol-3-phosphate acyltransferase [Paroceanicella profunda]
MRSVLFNLWLYGFTFAMAGLAWALSFVVGPRRLRGLLGLWARIMLGAVRLILGARVELRGRDALPPGGPALIVAKHQSELDAIALLALFPQAGAIAMQELEGYPFVGRVIRRLGYILVPVSGPPAGRSAAVIDGAARVHAEGRPVLIYPEGTLMSLGARERYRTGVWRIYDALGVEATPVALSVGVIWPRREWEKHPGTTGAVEFLPPIPPGLALEPFMARLEETIETATMALIEEHAGPERAARARALYAAKAPNED